MPGKPPQTRLRPTAHRLQVLVLTLSCCFCGGGDPEPNDRPIAAPVRFVVEELLTNPTETTAQITMIPDEAAELYAEYGPSAGSDRRRTPTASLQRSEAGSLQLSNLSPGTAHRYQIHVRRPGEAIFQRREPHTFRTLEPNRDAVVRFAYAADSHIAERWVASRCSSTVRSQQEVESFFHTVDHIRTGELDFLIAAGDNFMTHSPAFSSCDGLQEFGNGTVRTAGQAEARYREVLSTRLWGKLTADLPFFYVLGNHDGEARFGDAAGSYGHYPDTRRLSRAARLATLPDPTQVYDGSKNQDLYFSFTSGDARFIILDVMSGPLDYPTEPQDWTLGADQLNWLEKTLSENDRTWTFVFIEHLVGGVPGKHQRLRDRGDENPPEYAYGRGGIRSTVDGEPGSEFVGEQAVLQKLMRNHGVRFCFHAHDHVALIGEKKNSRGEGEGVYYIMGGQASGTRPRWLNKDRFHENADYDNDGQADFLSNVNGTLARGFYRVTVYGSERVEIAYIASAPDDPAIDGQAVLQLTLFQDGTTKWPKAE